MDVACVLNLYAQEARSTVVSSFILVFAHYVARLAELVGLFVSEASFGRGRGYWNVRYS